MKQIIALLKKDLLTEWRQRYALNGILLHVVASCFVVFLSVRVLAAPSWNAIYWIILLFTSVSAVAKSFIGESKGRQLYFYGIVSGQQIILSRMIYNTILMLVISFLSLVAYSIFMGNPVEHIGLYTAVILLGSAGFSATFTMLSSIAAKAGNSNLLMPVLSFPVIIPILLVAIKASKKAMDGLEPSLVYPDLLVLFAINLIVMVLAYILFPYLWKD